MHVIRFIDEYDAVGALYGLDADQLRRRDERQGSGRHRWVGVEHGTPVAAVQTSRRPDGRLFLSYVVDDAAQYEPLTEAAVDDLARPVWTMCDDTDTDALAALFDAGFRIEVTGERFVIPFALARRRLVRAWIPSGYLLESIHDVDEDSAFELDNRLRNLVPGTDGWQGDRTWFDEELRSDELDPSTYLVAIEQTMGEYAGLVRIWRNPDGPRLGLVGVLPEHRVRSLAASLLRQAVDAASTWGFDTLQTETSPSNPHTYRALLRTGVTPVGRFHQLVRPQGPPRSGE